MQPTEQDIIKAYNIAKETGADSTCRVLEALYPNVDFTPKDNRPVTERIKTFEDARHELGEYHPLVFAYQELMSEATMEKFMIETFDHDVVSYLKLRIVCAALNEGEKPRFTENDRRWYPLHMLWTADEIAKKSEEWRRDRRLIPTGDYQTEYAGFAFARSDYAPSAAIADIGSQVCLKSEALSDYCGRQFIDLWADFKLIRRR